jgi:hypothetical protein
MTNTKNETTYWGGQGRFQAAYEQLQERVPSSGKAPNAHLEMLRRFANTYWDIFNNGGCNIVMGYGGRKKDAQALRTSLRNNMGRLTEGNADGAEKAIKHFLTGLSEFTGARSHAPYLRHWDNTYGESLEITADSIVLWAANLEGIPSLNH